MVMLLRRRTIVNLRFMQSRGQRLRLLVKFVQSVLLVLFLQSVLLVLFV
jgi:hypothetical protein